MAGNRRIRTPQPEGPDVLRRLQLVDYGLQIAHATKAERSWHSPPSWPEPADDRTDALSTASRCACGSHDVARALSPTSRPPDNRHFFAQRSAHNARPITRPSEEPRHRIAAHIERPIIIPQVNGRALTVIALRADVSPQRPARLRRKSSAGRSVLGRDYRVGAKRPSARSDMPIARESARVWSP